MGIKLTIDEPKLKELMKRLDQAPKRIQKGAGKAAARAGANVVKRAVASYAPDCLVKSVKVRARSGRATKPGGVKFSITVGAPMNGWGLNKAELGAAAAKHDVPTSKISSCLPAIWYELGTYRNRNLSKDPYAPITMKKKDYKRLGHTGSPIWNIQNPTARAELWMGAQGFLRRGALETFHSKAAERAVARKLDDYLKKKGF